MALVCGGERQRGSWHWPPACGEGAARERAPAGSRTDCHQVGGKARRGARAAGMLGAAQHRQDAGRAGAVLALTLPDSPSQQHLQPCPGAEHKGPKAAPQSRDCGQGPCPGCGLCHGHRGRRCPARCSPVPGLLPAAGSRSGMGRQWVAAAEAWPLLLLKGTGGSEQAQGRWQGAGTQRTEPGTQLHRGQRWQG